MSSRCADCGAEGIWDTPSARRRHYVIEHGWPTAVLEREDIAGLVDEAEVRERIAADITARAGNEPNWAVDSGGDCGYWEGLTEAARIARGES